MNYQTYSPHPDLSAVVKCYWTLEVPASNEAQRQRIVPDGCIEMAFILGDDIKRYTSGDAFILQPRAMVLGQTIAPFYIEPTGYVNTFAVRFYPYGFANFISVPVSTLVNAETPIDRLFEASAAKKLMQQISEAEGTPERIQIIEAFLLNMLGQQQTIHDIVQTTIDALLSTNGNVSIQSILHSDPSRRRQLERKFRQQVGISAKQLGKVIRLQAALKMLLHKQPETLTRIAYDNDYYDQAHFIRDFKEFTGINPKNFTGDDQLLLSSVFYSEE